MSMLHIVALALRVLFGVDDARLAVTDLPEPCRMYAAIPADTLEDPYGWNQLLSLASCVQDASITPVARGDQLEPMVERYNDALYVPTLIYIGVLENAPGPVQLRAAYQLGLAHVMLVVRARRSVSTPALRARLERLLAPSLRVAWVSFSVVDRIAEEEPSLVTDEVSRNAVRSARALLRVLPVPADRRGGRTLVTRIR
jgi:hypothetical protein